MYKTYYDVCIVSQSGDTINFDGLSYSQMMKVAHKNPDLQSITIVKEYDKKIK
jgi:hypothetical protein